MTLRLPLLAVASLAIVVVALLIGGVGPAHALSGLISGSVGSSAAWSGTLQETAPLLMCGIAVFLALKAGLFNIGVEGQFNVGALVAAVIALRVPGIVGMLLACIFGAIGGGLWALPAGVIKAYRGGHEVITTIMLNSIAALLTTALVAKTFRDPSEESPTTSTLPLKLPTLISQPVAVTWMLPIGILLVMAVWWWLGRRVSGYELQVVGKNPVAADFAGIDRRQTIVRAMLISGMIGGLAGALQVVAVEGRFFADFSPGYGFDALGVALLAGENAFALLPCALLFGILSKGGTAIQIFGVPKGIVLVVLGAVMINAAAIRFEWGGRRVRSS